MEQASSVSELKPCLRQLTLKSNQNRKILIMRHSWHPLWKSFRLEAKTVVTQQLLKNVEKVRSWTRRFSRCSSVFTWNQYFRLYLKSIFLSLKSSLNLEMFSLCCFKLVLSCFNQVQADEKSYNQFFFSAKVFLTPGSIKNVSGFINEQQRGVGKRKESFQK